MINHSISGDSVEISKASILFAACLFAVVFTSRVLTSTSVYFADGPLHVAAVQDHTYILQAPGYWLFTRIAGLFPDPQFGISIMNWLFSAGGAAAFYLAIRKLVSEKVARAAAIAYASVYFAWFSGNIHSTYASQLFFPVAVFLCLLQYRENYKVSGLIGASVLFALGAGFRPSDGAFFAPAFLSELLKAKRKHILTSIAVIAVICLSWLAPQKIASAHTAESAQTNTQHQLFGVASGVLFSGFSPYAAADVLRYFLPLGLALFPLLPLAFKSKKDVFLWLWILPGTLFFLFIYISESPYLDFLLAPYLILAATNALVSERRKVLLFLFCAAFNLVFYFGWRPVAFSNPRLQSAEYVVEAYLGRHTYWCVQHHYQPVARDLLHFPPFKR